MKFENCLVVRLRNAESHDKVKSFVGNLHNVKVVLLDGTNGLLQITDKTTPEKLAQKMSNSVLFSAVTPVKYFNVC